MNLRKGLFILTHSAFDRQFMSLYQQLMHNLSRDYQELIEEQNSKLRNFIDFTYANVPYYRGIFDNLNIHPEEIQTRKDLERLPILNKQKIRDNFDDIVAKNLSDQKYFENRTSGSTGDPLRYYYSKYDRFMSGCLIYRGWSFAGYELGDKMIFLAGSSLGMNYGNKLVKLFHETTRNLKKLSSFDMDQQSLHRYRDIMNSYKPKFLRGYVSSIYTFAQWLDDHQLSVHSPKAVLTTAEKLFPHMREKISEVFGCEVFDNYGLNDGGISAYELSDHTGMRIDTERAILEVIDDQGKQIKEGTGRIIATGLLNTAFPFIRYDTGDIGTIAIKPDGTHVLTEIIGRQHEMLNTPEGKIIHGVYFGYVFRAMNGIRNFQVIQEDLKNIKVKLVVGQDFDMSQIEEMKKLIKKRSSGWQVEFEFVDEIDTSEAGKHRYVFNRLKEN